MIFWRECGRTRSDIVEKLKWLLKNVSFFFREWLVVYQFYKQNISLNISGKCDINLKGFKKNVRNKVHIDRIRESHESTQLQLRKCFHIKNHFLCFNTYEIFWHTSSIGSVLF